MAGRLEGKVAIITGAGSGIGEAIAIAYGAEGAQVIATDITGNENQTAEKVGNGCVAWKVDVTKGEDIKNAWQKAVDEFGKLDIVNNNAGIDGSVGPFGEYSEEDFDQVWNINGRGVFLGIRHAIPHMQANGGGSIINTASMASTLAFPGMNAYCASKGAVLQLTRTAAAEYAGEQIRVNSLCPGAIRTAITDSLPPELIQGVVDATPAGRFADPSEVASLSVFLASDESKYITGEGIWIDGGYSLV